jgi:hypothetical protein
MQLFRSEKFAAQEEFMRFKAMFLQFTHCPFGTERLPEIDTCAHQDDSADDGGIWDLAKKS